MKPIIANHCQAHSRANPPSLPATDPSQFPNMGHPAHLEIRLLPTKTFLPIAQDTGNTGLGN